MSAQIGRDADPLTPAERARRNQLRADNDLLPHPGGNCQRGAHDACLFRVDCPCPCHDGGTAFTVGGRLVTHADYLALTSALGYGDDTTEPAAHPRDLIDPLTGALHAAHEHDECPLWCDDCDQWEKPRSCQPCHGSGCGPGTATGAYDPCEHCASTGTDHQPYTLTGTWRGEPLT